MLYSQFSMSVRLKRLRMLMDFHIGKTWSKAFRGLYSIRQSRKFLSVESTKTLVLAFVSPYHDYCNSLLFGQPKYRFNLLQKFQNATAKADCPDYEICTHYTTSHRPTLASCIIQSSIKNLLLYVFKSLNSLRSVTSETCLQVCSLLVYTLSSVRSRVTCSGLGDRSFAHAAPALWHLLPHFTNQIL